MSGRPQDTFVVEAAELLQTMEDGLLCLEKDPADSDTINAIFRAVHTIKGTGGVFSYHRLEAFTHVVEHVLDLARAGRVAVDEDLIALLLSCRDHIERLVEAAVAESEPDSAAERHGRGLLDRLSAYLPGEQGAREAPAKDVPVASEEPEILDTLPVHSDNWHISLRFDPDVLRHGMDPLSFLRYLTRLGRIVHVTTLDGRLPLLQELDVEQLYLGWEIVFSSDADKAEIEGVFEFVHDYCQLHILPPRANIARYAQMIAALPEDDLQVGEILLKCGALTESELDEALNYQRRVSRNAEQEPSDSEPPRLGEILIGSGVVHEEVVNAALEKQATVRERTAAAQMLRVDADKLDKLINLVGELVISGAGTRLLAQRTGDEELLESFSVMARLVEEIRDSALRLRMVQIGETFNRFKRVVRDVSKELGKDIRLHISGAETELDKTVVEKIGDPLMHLVRNAMDHGLELPAERLEAGKHTVGTLSLHACHDAGSILIEVADDGRGLDRDRILAKARERGLVGAEQSLSDRAIYNLIFEPGFSTAERVTNLSGRGVGMDVVKRNIEALRGTIEVNSRPGAGTKVGIRLPLTLAIIDGFLVRVGQASYVIPLDMVQECMELQPEHREADSQQGYMNLRGELLPYLRLRLVFDEQAPDNPRENLVVVHYGAHRSALVVDELLGEVQTVIKPLGKVFKRLSGISGATILGSGEVAVILDVPHLIQAATAEAGPDIHKQRQDRPTTTN